VTVKKLNHVLLAVSASILAITTGCDGSNVHPCDTDDDCADYADQPVCDTDAGICVPGEGEGEGVGEGEGEGEGECDPTDPDLGPGDPVCLDAGELCSDDELCVAPEEVTDTCASGFGNDGGPILYIVAEVGNNGVSNNCDGGDGTVYTYAAMVRSGVAISENIYTERIRFNNGTTTTDVFSDGPGTEFHPTVDDLGDGDYMVNFSLCGSPDAGSWLGITDDDGTEGNAYCF
jgi:hypothetical protein